MWNIYYREIKVAFQRHKDTKKYFVFVKYEYLFRTKVDIGMLATKIIGGMQEDVQRRKWNIE